MYPIDFIYKACRQFPQRIAIESATASLTFKDLAHQVDSLAAALQQLDPRPASRVGICAGNSIEHIVTLLAVMAAEKTWVPLNARNSTLELNRSIAFTEPSIVFAECQHLSTLDLSNVPHKISIDENSGGTVLLSELFRDFSGKSPVRSDLPLDTPQAIKFTGGSTGAPKGVMQPYRAWVTTTINQIHEYGLGPDDVYLVSAPVTHGTSTYIVPILARGGRLILPENNKPATLLDAFRHKGITTTFLPPTLIYMLMAEGEHEPQSFPALRHLIYGGAPMPVEKIRQARKFFGPVLETTYGQTEAPQIVTVMRASDFEDEKNWSSVGRQALLSDVAIVGPDGTLLGPTEVGEIVVRGDIIMSGYWKMPEKTAETIVNGWLHTGDRGFIDERGYLYLKDRLRDVVITGGFNVYPIDVESVLDQHPAVHESAVFGLPDEKWGEAVHAAIQLKPGATVTPGELTGFAKERLGSVKTPKRFHFFDNFPRSVAGKVHKPTIKQSVQDAK